MPAPVAQQLGSTSKLLPGVPTSTWLATARLVSCNRGEAEACLRLLLDSWVPPGVHEHHVAGHRQVEGDAAGLEGHEETGDCGVLVEGFDRLAPLVERHATLKLDALDGHLQRNKRA